MSAYNPENGIEGAFVGATVWWRQLYDDGLNGAGRIYGFVWDTSDNGAIIEFNQGVYTNRYFISFKELERVWKNGTFYIDEAKFISIVTSRVWLVTNKVFPLGFIKRNQAGLPKGKQQRVPVWTQYR